MAELRCTRPCRKCVRERECAAFIRELRAVIADFGSCPARTLPDVVVDCMLYTPLQPASSRARTGSHRAS
jgi:hypothetical protein